MFIEFMAFCIDENPVSSLKTTLQHIIHALVSLHASNQLVSSKSSNHEMTWLNPQLQNFHFISLINSLLRIFLDKLAVANTEGCFNAFSVWVVEQVAFPFYFILLPFFNKITLEIFYVCYGIFDWLPFRADVELDPLS